MKLQKFYRLSGLTSIILALSGIVVTSSAIEALTLDGQKVSQVYQRSGLSVNRKCSLTRSSSGDIAWFPANTSMVMVDHKLFLETL